MNAFKRFWLVSLALLLGLAWTNFSNANFTPLILNEASLLNEDGSIVIRPKEGKYDEAYNLALQQSHWVEKKRFVIVILGIAKDQKEQVVENLKKSSILEYVEPQVEFSVFATPNDQYFSNQKEYLDALSIPEAWEYTTGSTSQQIGIMDTGINGLHEDLAGKVVAGRNFIGTSKNIASGIDSDDHNPGHGSVVAGIIGATTNNSKGIAGVNWHAKLVPIKILNSSGVGSGSDAAEGIMWAADQGIKIINLSAGSSEESQVVKDAIDYAYDKGTIVVAASGNDGTNAITFPANYSKVVAVGSSKISGETSNFSNVGAGLDFMAVGEGVRTIKDGLTDYVTVSGTSVAAPQVSGAISLVMQATGLSAIDSIQLLGATATILPSDYKRPSAEKAIDTYMNPPKASIVKQSRDILYAYPGGVFDFSVTVRNSGKTTWYSSGENRIILRLTPFGKMTVSQMSRYNPKNWHSKVVVAQLNEDVPPNTDYTFSFQVKVPWNTQGGKYYLGIQPFTPLRGDIGESLDWTMVVPEPSLQLLGKSANIVNAQPGSTYTLSASYKNTGTTPFTSGTHQLRLALDGSSSELVQMRRFNPKTWINSAHMTGLSKTISPQDKFTLSYKVRVPWNSLPGNYTMRARPIINTYKDFDPSQSASWTISVAKPNAKLISQSSHFSAQKGGTYDLAVTLRNNGVTTWQKNTNAFQLELTDEVGGSLANLTEMERLGRAVGTWISKDRVIGLDHSVPAGENYTFNFKIRIPWSINYDRLRLSLKPTQNNYLPFPVTRGAVSWIIGIIN